MLQKTLLASGLLIVTVLLSACANEPKPSVRIDYSPEFLECVANDIEASKYSPCTINALSDWEVVVVK